MSFLGPTTYFGHIMCQRQSAHSRWTIPADIGTILPSSSWQHPERSGNMHRLSAGMRGTILFAILFAIPFTGGCGWMGRTAGKAHATSEKGVEAVEQGYNDGYTTEKDKKAGQEAPAP
jgi:hypothetical protein